MTTCIGPATYTAVGPGQATGDGALYAKGGADPLRGGTPGTAAVQRGFLGLSTRQLRDHGRQIQITPDDDGAVAKTGGQGGTYTVSDYGDRNVQGTNGTAFDLYRWDTQKGALAFGRRRLPTTISFPADIGGRCPTGWTLQ